jgi:hypothetical protein
MTARC